MRFVNREKETERLDRLVATEEGAFGVVYGRRRIGKTRLILEWCRKHRGVYTVADRSAAEIQRRYFAEAISSRLPGFGAVAYPDWRALLSRLAADARATGWRGPVVFDEFPYLVLSSPEFPSILQQWVDHEARECGLSAVIVGSSQRMMQGLALSRESPLYGRAAQVLELTSLRPRYVPEVFPTASAPAVVETYTAWGGIPRYWELALGVGTASIQEQMDDLVLDPMGPLHQEPDYLLLEELPSARELRPVLDAIGFGSHRISEIAGRLGRPATSLTRPISRLVEMGLVGRDVPFGEDEKNTKKALYRVSDPFFRAWFRVVAPNRSALGSASPTSRKKLLQAHWDELVAATWEDLCREEVNTTHWASRIGKETTWEPPRRWWSTDVAEWDVVARDDKGKMLLLGEAKWSRRPFSQRDLEQLAGALLRKPLPTLSRRDHALEPIRALFVPETRTPRVTKIQGIHVVHGREILGLG